MRTIFDINISNNTRANHALLVGREAVRNAIIGAYREVTDEETALVEHTIDDYNGQLGDADLEVTANEVRYDQGHDKVVPLGKWCALADAAHDELDDLVQEMKDEAGIDARGNIIGLKGILFFKRDLRTTVDEVFKREWELPTEAALSQRKIEETLDLHRKAYGSVVTVQSVMDHMLEQKRKIGEKYRARFDDIVRRIEEHALNNRKVDCASFESLYKALMTREQQGRHVRALLSMIDSSTRSFQAKARAGNWSPEWAATIVTEKEADKPALLELKQQLADTEVVPA